MPSSAKFAVCERKGCRSRSTHQVKFDKFDNTQRSVKACFDHAAWWAKGYDGMRIGSVTKLTLVR